MKNRFFIAFSLLRKNIKNIIIFEAIYKLFTTAVFTPLLVKVFQIALKLSGINYLTNARFDEFILKPTTIAIIMLLLIVFAIFTLIEMSALAYCYHMSYNNMNVGWIDMIKEGIKSAFKLLWNSNFLMIFYIILLVPITHLVAFSGYVSMIKVPEFIILMLKRNEPIFMGVIIGYLILSVFLIRWINVINYFAVEKMSFKNARKASINMNKNSYPGLIISYVLWQIMAYLIYMFLYVGITFVITKCIGLFFKYSTAYKISLVFAKVLYELWLTLYSFIIVPVTFAFLSGYYFVRKNKMYEEMVVPVCEKKDKSKKLDKTDKKSKFTRAVYLTVFFSAVLNIFYLTFNIGISRGSINVQLLNETDVAAHRGYSAEAPENTIPAFEAAIANLTDYVELDVQELKDGTVVVMHDSNFKRVGGLKKNVWEVEYDDIKELDVGKWFSEEFEGTTIPTLEEVLELSKGRLKLNIEIKLNGHEKKLEETVVGLIEKYEMEDECVITSFQSKALKNVKKYNKNIKTGYVLHVAYGDFSHVEFADALSVNYSFATQSLVNDAHNAGMEVYVWTVNTSEAINEMLERGVDMIITDDPVLAEETFTSYETNPYVVKLIKRILK